MKTKKERASWPMRDWEVRAIRDGSKTQARQIFKQATGPSLSVGIDENAPGVATLSWLYGSGPNHEIINESVLRVPCPYGQPGDQIWMREATHRRPMLNFITSEPLDSKYDGGAYTADDEDVLTSDGFDLAWWQSHKSCPASQMPRHASRTTLEIVSVRVERLQDISEADALAEGCNGDCPVGSIRAYNSGRHSYHYAQVWDSINGKGSWGLNPWVWVIEFKIV